MKVRLALKNKSGRESRFRRQMMTFHFERGCRARFADGGRGAEKTYLAPSAALLFKEQGRAPAAVGGYRCELFVKSQSHVSLQLQSLPL